MASGSYKTTRLAIENGTEAVDWDTDRIDAVLVRTSGGGGTPYTINFDTDDFLDDIPTVGGYARVATATSVSTSTDKIAGAVRLKCTTIDFGSPASGDAAHGVVFYKYNASEAAARLLYFCDAAVTPDGNPVTVSFTNDVVVTFTDV